MNNGLSVVYGGLSNKENQSCLLHTVFMRCAVTVNVLMEMKNDVIMTLIVALFFRGKKFD